MAAPKKATQIVLNRHVHEVTTVDKDGGFYTRHEPGDGSGPTTHYWTAGTDWRCAAYTLHPFGDEWLWDETGRRGLTVPLSEAVKVVEAHRAECMKGDKSQRDFFAGMWFSVCEAEFGDFVALVSPGGNLLRGAEATAWYACIGTDGEWPKPTSILIEWDGGFATACSDEEAEALINRKLSEWEAAGDAGERGDFLVRPNTPEAI